MKFILLFLIQKMGVKIHGHRQAGMPKLFLHYFWNHPGLKTTGGVGVAKTVGTERGKRIPIPATFIDLCHNGLDPIGVDLRCDRGVKATDKEKIFKAGQGFGAGLFCDEALFLKLAFKSGFTACVKVYGPHAGLGFRRIYVEGFLCVSGELLVDKSAGDMDHAAGQINILPAKGAEFPGAQPGEDRHRKEFLIKASLAGIKKMPCST